MGMAYKVYNTDSPMTTMLITYSEDEAAKYLEEIGGHGVDSTTYNCEVIDTISGDRIGGASICYGKRSLMPNTSSLLVTQLSFINRKWIQ